MILSDKTIKKLIQSQELTVEPCIDSHIQPSSIDFTLGNHFLEVNTHNTELIRLDEEVQYREIISDSIIIPPHSFLLATTQEYIKLPNHISAFVEGRSSIGRIGLFIQNAGWIDAGFEGKITLELYNANSLPIKLQRNRRICQIVFCHMDHAADQPYRGKYLGQDKSMGSRIFLDTEVTQPS